MQGSIFRYYGYLFLIKEMKGCKMPFIVVITK